MQVKEAREKNLLCERRNPTWRKVVATLLKMRYLIDCSSNNKFQVQVACCWYLAAVWTAIFDARSAACFFRSDCMAV